VSYLIDTNVIAEVRKGPRCDSRVARWYATLADDDLYLSVLVLGEIRRGLEIIRIRHPDRASRLEQWLHAVGSAFRGRILPVDQAVAEEWGRMSAIRSVPAVDGLLAATAKISGLTLATRNVADVTGLGADVVNPFDPR
jgi:toxin FitB